MFRILFIFLIIISTANCIEPVKQVGDVILCKDYLRLKQEFYKDPKTFTALRLASMFITKPKNKSETALSVCEVCKTLKVELQISRSVAQLELSQNEEIFQYEKFILAEAIRIVLDNSDKTDDELEQMMSEHGISIDTDEVKRVVKSVGGQVFKGGVAFIGSIGKKMMSSKDFSWSAMRKFALQNSPRAVTAFPRVFSSITAAMSIILTPSLIANGTKTRYLAEDLSRMLDERISDGDVTQDICRDSIMDARRSEYLRLAMPYSTKKMYELGLIKANDVFDQKTSIQKFQKDIKELLSDIEGFVRYRAIKQDTNYLY